MLKRTSRLKFYAKLNGKIERKGQRSPDERSDIRSFLFWSPHVAEPVIGRAFARLRVHRATGIPHALIGAEDLGITRAFCVAGTWRCVWEVCLDVGCLKLRSSSPAKAGDPVFQRRL
jgi:hypothetical protein